MDLYADLIRRTDAIIASGRLAESTLSQKLFGDSRRLGLIRNDGKDVTVSTFERAMKRLADIERQHSASIEDTAV